MNERYEQLQNWKRSMELKAMGLEPGQDYLAQLTYKIAEKAFGKQDKKNLDMKVCEMIEQQTCAICYELMVPPTLAPILLFPCGHTFCKECTIDKGRLKKPNCCLCRAKITAHAVNISLQNLICSFSEQKQNQQQQKEKIPDPVQQPKDNQYTTQYKMFKLRCDILTQEQSSLKNEIKQLSGQKLQEESELSYIKQQIQSIQNKMKELQEQWTTLTEIERDSQQKVEVIVKKINKCEEQCSILESTLKPLLVEMRKYELLCQQQ